MIGNDYNYLHSNRFEEKASTERWLISEKEVAILN